MPRITITRALIGQTDLYEVWCEDEYRYFFDYYVVVKTADPKVEYRHRDTFRTEAEAEKAMEAIVKAGSIDIQHWHAVDVLTTKERFAELAAWERKNDALNGHWSE
jgi:hypothetical protein